LNEGFNVVAFRWDAEGWYDTGTSTITLPLPDVPAGTYVLRVQAGAVRKSYRLVVQR